MKKIVILSVLSLVTFLSNAQNQAVYVEKNGDGSPILWLPGFTSPGTVWEGTLVKMEDSYENHVVSYAGFNGNAPIGFPWYQQVKEALIEYIEKEELMDVILVGHSMGGDLAIDLAVHFPDRIDKTILVDALPCIRALMMPDVPASQLQYDSPYNNRMLEMDETAFDQTAQMMASNMSLNQDKTPLLKQWILEADRETYVYGFTDLLKLDLRESLKEIKIPTLVLAASFPNKAMVTKNMEEQFANLTDKEIRVVEESKHFIMYDQPEWLANQINSFLAE